LDGGGEDARAATDDPDGMATTERGIRSYLDGDVSLEPPATHEHLSPGTGFLTRRHGARLCLIACSRCLRVLRDEEWVEAETVICERRSFEYEEPPRFEPVLCPICTLSIQLRRAQTRVPLRRETVRSRGRH